MASTDPLLPKPRRGEIWFIKLATDPADKDPRPVVIVSLDGRNQHPLASTVTAVPLSTTLSEYPSHVRFTPAETGLNEISEAQGENITVLLKKSLIAPKSAMRTFNNAALRKVAAAVVRGMGVLPEELC
jgi:mRNA-degrading endonuclease toxin of MazEF toxin-antitoxin module